jgi:hypothetical protein
MQSSFDRHAVIAARALAMIFTLMADALGQPLVMTDRALAWWYRNRKGMSHLAETSSLHDV